MSHLSTFWVYDVPQRAMCDAESATESLVGLKAMAPVALGNMEAQVAAAIDSAKNLGEIEKQYGWKKALVPDFSASFAQRSYG